MNQNKLVDRQFTCPHCGEPVDAEATFCRACGASEDAGWDHEGVWYDEQSPATYESEDDFDYEAFIDREFPTTEFSEASGNFQNRQWIWLVFLLCLALLLTMFLA